MSADKPFCSYDVLLDKLSSEKNLSVPNREHATKLLRCHSYFALVSGYKSPFKDSGGVKYKDGTTIDDIFALYTFDDNLRFLLLRYILIVEKHIKSSLSYSFCQCFGEKQQHYLDECNYNNTAANHSGIVKLIGILTEVISPPFAYHYIEHQHSKYGNIPLWVAIKALPFGSVSKLYSFSLQKVRVQVSREFGSLLEGDLANMLDLLTRFRNVCAHNERLFDYRYMKGAIPDTSIHARLLGPKPVHRPYAKGKSDLFAALICLKYLLDDSEFMSLVDEIQNQLDVLLHKTALLRLPDMLAYMGFPPHWQDIKSLPKN